MGNYYYINHVRNGEVIDRFITYGMITPAQLNINSQPVDVRTQYFLAGFNALAVAAGGSTFDIYNPAIIFLPSDYTVDALSFADNQPRAKIYVMGTNLKNGDRLLFDNNNGWYFSLSPNLAGQYTTLEMRPIINNQLVGTLTGIGLSSTGAVGFCPTIIRNGGWGIFSGNAVSGSVPMALRVAGTIPTRNNSGTDFTHFYDDLEPVDMNEPYPNIPSSEPSGPSEGTGIPDSDPIDIPGLPGVSVTATGFVGLFNPTMAQVQSLADYMWTGLFDVDNFKKIFADPMDCILGFNMVPVNVPSGSPVALRVGNISTGVTMNVATSQWVEVDCGSITLDLPYGCYLDYAPYSKFSIYLPYIGIVELSADDIVGKTITLKYHVDILSCSCVAFLKCGDSTLYQWTGSCGYSIPITGDNFRQTIANIVSIAATIGGAVATGGLSAPIAAAGMIKGGATVAQNVMNAKPEVHRSGSIGSSAGMMGLQTPYLIMELPNACKPEKQYHYLGYPGFITATIGNLTGFATFESVILDGIGCTSEERQMIESYCNGGIFI